MGRGRSNRSRFFEWSGGGWWWRWIVSSLASAAFPPVRAPIFFPGLEADTQFLGTAAEAGGLGPLDRISVVGAGIVRIIFHVAHSLGHETAANQEHGFDVNADAGVALGGGEIFRPSVAGDDSPLP